jgi:tetratricopeptide (TPR) repeat protein
MYPPGSTITTLPQLDLLIDWLYQNPDAPGYIPTLSFEMKHLYTIWARGQELEHQGQFQAAIEMYKRALQIAPAFINARFSWARSLQALRQYPEALSQLQVITTFYSPNDSNIYLQMASIQRELGDSAAEISSYEKALSIEPDNIYAWLNLGLARRLVKDLDASSQAFGEAIRCLDNLIRDGQPHQYDPEEDKICFEAARTEFARSAFDEAEPLFKRVMGVRGQSLELWGDPQHNPTVFYTMLFLARIYLRQGKWSLAMEQLERCTAFAPSDPNVGLLTGNARNHGTDPLPATWIWDEM